MERAVNPHSFATLSFTGRSQVASLKSVPSNKTFDMTEAMCFSNKDNFPPTYVHAIMMIQQSQTQHKNNVCYAAFGCLIEFQTF